MNQGRAKERQRQKPGTAAPRLSLSVAQTAHSLKAVPLKARRLTSAFAGNCQWSVHKSYPKHRIKNWSYGPSVEDLQTS